MKKKLLKIATAITACTVALACTAAAWAAETYTITIDQKETDHEYAVYQVFSGDLHEGVLSNIQWGDGITEDGKQQMGDVKDKVKELNNAEDAERFANEVSKYLDASKKKTVTYNDNDGYKLSDLQPGYYFIQDARSNLADGEAMTKYILKVVENVTAKPKNTGAPTIDKEITGEADKKTSEASIGDKVEFKITATIPEDAKNYNHYYFVINGAMDEGLGFDKQSVKVNADDAQLADTTDYVLMTEGTSDGHTFEIALKNAKAHAGKTVVVTYSATLTKDAVIAGDGNNNKANITYSNNPNFTYDEKDKPGQTEPTGKTPDSTTVTFTTGLIINKVDQKQEALKGASFKISGNGVNIVLVSSETFEVSGDGAYWKLKDGTYTTTDPAGPNVNKEKYADETTKYSKKVEFKPETKDAHTAVTAQTGDDGVLTFNGLGVGTYTISETVTPQGYNTIEDFDVEIKFNAKDKTFSATATKGNDVAVSGNVITMNIVNVSGNTLPSTGGMGTTLFYVLGGLIFAGASILMVVRKRSRK